MNRLALALLLALSACRKPAPAAPSAAAIGAELATFPQVFVPLAQEALNDLSEAIKRRGAENVQSSSFRQSFTHGSATVNGAKLPTFVAYTSPWLAPRKTELLPMSIVQFLRAFAADEKVEIVMVVAPKGNIFFTREQLPDVIGAARDGGASSNDLPLALISGSGKP